MKTNLKEIHELLQLINYTNDKDKIRSYRNRINVYFTAEMNRKKHFSTEEEYQNFLNKTF